MESKKITFILPVLGQPRHSKRISMLSHRGFVGHVLAFDRKYHKGRIPCCSIDKLGSIKNKNYFSRIPIFFTALFKIRKEAKKSSYIYAFGTDLGIISYFACLGLKKFIVVEIGDLRWVQCSSSLVGKIFRKVEGFFVKRYNLLVVISDGFLNQYYRNWLGLMTPGLVIENKIFEDDFKVFDVVTKTTSLTGKPLIDRPLRIGYFGLLRDEWSFNVLKTLADKHSSKFEIVFAGYPVSPDNFKKLISDSTSMSYLGEYKSPEDLASIYSKVDMSWACYPEIKKDDYNFRWGRPNRFYEGCYFKKPFFCREGSLFAHDVDKYGIGISVIDVNVDIVVSKLSKITYENFSLWYQSIRTLPKHLYIYQNEGTKLASSLINNNKEIK